MKDKVSESGRGDKDFMRVISIFLLIFASLVFVAVFITEGYEARITNLVCSLLLAVVAGIFYYGFKRAIK